MKTCARCLKPRSSFGWKNKRKGTHDAYCKPCRREYNREHYKNNRESYYAKNKRRINELRSFLRTLKLGKKCADCKRPFPPCVLDFHHKDPRKKISGVGLLITAFGSKAKILTEIAKCTLVCANCHRLRTCKKMHDHARKA